MPNVHGSKMASPSSRCWPSGCRCLWPCLGDPESRRRRADSRRIDRRLEKDKRELRREVRLLLLGAGESGKSTFLKQMRIIHGYDFLESTKSEFREIIYTNVVKGAKVLVDARRKLGIPWADPRRQADADFVLRFDNSMGLDTKVFLGYVPVVRRLWEDAALGTAYDRRREFQLADSVKYFLDNIDRIGTQEYVPSNQDILHARRATKGISELMVNIRGIPFLFVDVGGQRSQRQKWFQCFDCVTSILFLVSSSEFDQVLLEDRMTNRLTESKNIFETIVNNRCFSDVSIILFLNKTDLLKQKLQRGDADLPAYLPRYAGDPRDLDGVQRHMVDMFDEVRHDRRKPFFYHFTTAVDTENIKVVFNAVRDSILTKNLKQLMLQ